MKFSEKDIKKLQESFAGYWGALSVNDETKIEEIKMEEYYSEDDMKFFNSIPDISPEEFTYDKYIGTIGYSTCDVMSEFCTNNLNSNYIYIGKASAEKIPFRPRNGYALMICNTETNEKFWTHAV